MPISYRPATMEDSSDLFEWRNDPQTRANSRSSEPVLWSDHIGWLTRRLARTNPLLFVAMNGAEKVGTFRVDDDEISYTVAPALRGQGYGTSMLKMAFRDFGPLRAEIKAENVASVRAATTAGHTVVLLTHQP